MSARAESLLHCSFCEKSQEKVRKLIAGPGVYICDECINLCNEIIDGEFIDVDGVKRAIAGTTSDTSLAALTEASSRVDRLVAQLRDDGVAWEEIARALRKDTDED